MNSPMVRRCLGVAVSMLCMAAGCTTLPPDGKKELLSAQQQYDQGNPAGSERLTSRVISRYPDKLEIAEAHYLRGLARVRQGRAGQARRDFREAITRSKRTDLTSYANTALAMLSQRDGDFNEAADYYQAAVVGSDDHSHDELLYNLGVCLQRSAQWKRARESFLRLLEEAPDSAYAARARSRADWPNRFFSIQCGVFNNPTNADRLVSEFSQHGLLAFVHPRGGRADGSRPVYVGRFVDYHSARKALPGVRRFVHDAYVVP